MTSRTSEDRPDLLPPALSPLLRMVGRRDGWTCWICGAAVDASLRAPDPMAATKDHVVERRKGGQHLGKKNLRLAHSKCNNARSNGRRGDDL